MSHNHDTFFSRRAFLQSVGAGISSSNAALANTAVERTSEFRPASKPRRLSENLFLLEDTCNVYLIRNGQRGILIDFGSGAILNYLPEFGISKIDWILHTHHHRDQAQGDHLAVALRIPIAVPEHERKYFESAEDFWRDRRIFEMYNVMNDFFSLTKNVPVAALLQDYQMLIWEGHQIFIQPTPGHTVGSITLVTDIDGKKVAFSGDLMHSPGKVQTLYDLQYYYQEHEGVDLSIYSLTELAKLKPDLLCPSHGEPVQDPLPGMAELSKKLTEWHYYWYSHPPTSLLEPFAVSPHLVASTDTTSSFYAIISDSGKALFVDYGSASWTYFQVFTRYSGVFGHMRFVEHTIEKIRARYGMKSVEAAIPTHMHDDHLNGFPYLVNRYGAKIWCYENFAEILENPRAMNLGCTFGEPIRVDRRIGNRETFKWEEFEFTVVHSPGHTNYQMAMFSTIDGARVAFTGDAFFNDPQNPLQLRHNLIYRNEVRSGDHAKSIRNILEFEPNIIAPGHGRPFLIDRATAENFKAHAEKQDAFFRDLIADPDTNMGLDPSWIRLFPYQMIVLPGQTKQIQVRARNYRPRPVHLEGMLVMPHGWRSSPEKITLDVPANGNGTAHAAITIPREYSNPFQRVAIALDVSADGRYLGQITEAVVDLKMRST
jgi:glyoxylase-like metal-dependent hydrolase (beta-lactamase superfamily II)